MKNPIWTIAKAIDREAKRAGSFAALAEEMAEPDKNKRPPVDRRKLKRIVDGKDFTISTAELAALDKYFTPKGDGLGDHPLYTKQSILQSLSGCGNLTALIGAYHRYEEQRNDVSLWDVQTFQVIVAGLHQFREVIDDKLQEVPFLNSQAKQNRDPKGIKEILEKTNQTVCSIGSPRSNPASEIILAEMFGVQPFMKTEKKVPFKILWNDDRDRELAVFSSAFEAKSRELEGLDPELAKRPPTGRRIGTLIVGGKAHPVVSQHSAEWHDYGIIAVQRLPEARLRIVVAGVSGPSTFACAQACLRGTLMPKLNTGDALFAVVKAVIRPSGQGIGDTRKVRDAELLDDPVIWQGIKGS